jgi:hypothetical protein
MIRLATSCLVVGFLAGLAVGVLGILDLTYAQVVHACGWVAVAIAFLWAVTPGGES